MDVAQQETRVLRAREPLVPATATMRINVARSGLENSFHTAWTQSGHLNSLWTVTIAIADGTALMQDKPSPGDATTFAMSHAGLGNRGIQTIGRLVAAHHASITLVITFLPLLCR